MGITVRYKSIYFLASSKDLKSAGTQSCLPTSVRLIEIKLVFDHFQADKKNRAIDCALVGEVLLRVS